MASEGSFIPFSESSGIMSFAPVPVQKALLSVSDKSGLVDFAKGLANHNISLISTGGTYKTLLDAGLKAQSVDSVTHFPEIMDGRVKTLHPAIHGAILADRNKPAHQQAMSEHNIEGIDLVVINLYPFEATMRSGADVQTIIENIDIGGPAMIRAAAKNHAHVAVVVDPADYSLVLQNLSDHQGHLEGDLRAFLAQKAFARTAHYDAMISNWLAEQQSLSSPAYRVFGGPLLQSLRYGENPHQKAGFYKSGEQRHGVATARQIQGKELSYNNINDTDAAFELISEFDPEKAPAVAIIKHANPCGVALGDSLLDAYTRALRCDPVSAFGGIVALNRPLDVSTAEAIAGVFTEVIIAPGADEDALSFLAKKKNLRILLTEGLADPRAAGFQIKTVAGGYLVQDRDHMTADQLDLKVVTQRQPTPAELSDMIFAFQVAKHVKSNTIIYAKDKATVGIGAGQMSRLDSARIAARKAQDATEAAGETQLLTEGCVVASDAFFPFADGMLAAAEAGATAVIQPGGSMRDDEVIRAADEKGLAMVMTGIRHFKH
jgi:phosphoribosylaminoimidazolecarboxamide formyltransferase/IMP cyclohydrolase